MARLTAICAFTFCSFALAKSASGVPEFGLGFSLSLDYGVASIYFSNGSSVGIAKVEGGWEYKEMMRSQNWSLPTEDGDLYSGVDARVAHGHQPKLQSLMNAAGLRDHLPPWLGGRTPDAQVQVLSRMLQALKVASEAYVGVGDVMDVGITFPARPNQSMRSTADTAASQSRLNIRLVSAAGLQAAYASGIGRHDCYFPPDPPEQLVLAVDYSRAAVTAMLYSEECGIFELLRGLHNITLGADNWSWQNRDLLISELRRIVRLPVHRPDNVRLERIGALVLLGEYGTNKRLKKVLREVFESLEINDSVEVMLNQDEDMVDPLYAAASGAAEGCREHLVDDERGGLCSVPIPVPPKELR